MPRYMVTETKDPYFIKAVLNVGDVYDSFTYDGTIPFAHWVPDVSASTIWLIMYKDANIAGLFRGDRVGNKVILPHVVIYPEYRGVDSKEWGKLGIEYCHKYYGITTFLAMTPSIAAKKYAEAVGYKHITILKNSLQKNGELLDQYLLEYKV